MPGNPLLKVNIGPQRHESLLTSSSRLHRQLFSPTVLVLLSSIALPIADTGSDILLTYEWLDAGRVGRPRQAAARGKRSPGAFEERRQRPVAGGPVHGQQAESCERDD